MHATARASRGFGTPGGGVAAGGAMPLKKGTEMLCAKNSWLADGDSSVSALHRATLGGCVSLFFILVLHRRDVHFFALTLSKGSFPMPVVIPPIADRANAPCPPSSDPASPARCSLAPAASPPCPRSWYAKEDPGATSTRGAVPPSSSASSRFFRDETRRRARPPRTPPPHRIRCDR